VFPARGFQQQKRVCCVECCSSVHDFLHTAVDQSRISGAQRSFLLHSSTQSASQSTEVHQRSCDFELALLTSRCPSSSRSWVSKTSNTPAPLSKDSILGTESHHNAETNAQPLYVEDESPRDRQRRKKQNSTTRGIFCVVSKSLPISPSYSFPTISLIFHGG
jgi:hypothetical protein